MGQPGDETATMTSYTITLERTPTGWRAWCQALPECRGEGKNRRQAYKAVKRSIREHLRGCLREGSLIPIDRTTTKFFRINLRTLQEPGPLR